MRKIITKHPFILAFSTLQIFFSAPGQTFLISLFVVPVFSKFAVSESFAAGIYSTATLSAALLLNPAGRLIDKYPVQRIIQVTCCLMAAGCWILAGSQNLFMIFIGFFLLRLIGQGVFGLTASTLMVKKFERNRGKALGIATLGFPLSEAIYPFLAVFLLSAIGWRMSYVLFGLSNIILMLPLQLYLLHKANIKHGEFLPGEVGVNPQKLRGHPEERKIRHVKDMTLEQAIKDPKFYLILASAALPPMIVTGLFYHQSHLFEANGWAITLAASGLLVYAIAKATGSLWIGGVVDKYGPFIPFIVLILMLGVGTFLAGLGGSKIIIFIYFCLIGAALGFSSPVTNVVWPYFYGAKYMGSIKGFVATFRNGLTALAPLPVAIAMDMGISVNIVLKLTSVFICLMSLLPLIVWRWDESQSSKKSI